jgi:O-antigen/teichoic acid export membrane protein
MAAAFAVIGFFFGPRWFNVSPANVITLQLAFLAAAVGLFFSYYGQFWNILAQVHLDFRFISVLRTITALLQIGGGVLIAALTRNPVLIIAWGTLLSILQLGAFIWHAGRSYHFGIHWRLARVTRIREIRGFTAKTFLTLLVNNLLGGLDRLALGRLAPPVAFANYAICTNAGQRINGLSVSLMGRILGNSSRAVGAGGKALVAQIYEESFDLMFGWIVLAAVWLVVWRHAILTVWLGPTLGAAVEPILPPIIVAYCITAMANISAAQLGPLNRVGMGLLIHLAAGFLVAGCVYLGWRWGGIIGVAYGFLVSRIAFLFQDLFVSTTIGARGWVSPERWSRLALQVAIGVLLWFSAQSMHLSLSTQVLLAIVHGGAGAAWLVRHDLTNGLIALRS